MLRPHHITRRSCCRNARTNTMHRIRIRQIDTQIVHQGFQSRPRDTRFRRTITFALQIEKSLDGKGVALAREIRGSCLHGCDNMIIHVIVAPILEPIRISTTTTRCLDDAEISDSRPKQTSRKSDFGPPMRSTTTIVATLLRLQGAKTSTTIANHHRRCGTIAPEKFDLCIRWIDPMRDIGFPTGRGAERIRLPRQHIQINVRRRQQRHQSNRRDEEKLHEQAKQP